MSFALRHETPDSARLVLDVFVPGDPKPKGSVSAFVPPGSGRAIVTHNTIKGAKEWAQRIVDVVHSAAFEFVPAKTPLEIVAVFALPRPLSASRKRSAHELAAKKPDIDKLMRALLDALTHVVWGDDSQIVRALVEKRVADPGERPGVHVRVWRVAS